MISETKKIIRKLQANLIRINNKERFFFNISQYKNLGLIKERNVYGIDSTGNKVRIKTNYLLTEKAKQYINVIV